MLRVGVMVSGGGTNLQAILDAVDSGKITGAEIAVVISNNPGAYALERARSHGIQAVCMSPKSFESREAFNEAFLAKVDEYELDLIVLAGFLVTIPAAMIAKYRNRIINVHPVPDPLLLRSGLLWTDGPSGGPGPGSEDHRRHRAFCGRGNGLGPHYFTESRGGAAGGHAGGIAAAGDGAGGVGDSAGSHRQDRQRAN